MSIGRPTVTIACGSALAVGLAGAVAAPATAQDDEVTLYVVQGLPGEEVDVSVDGETLAKDVQAAEVAGPFTVSPGERTWTFTDGDDEVLVENTVSASAGDSSDVVLHLPADAGGDPVLTVYQNDLSAVPEGKASVTVAHTAAVPPADIVVDDEVLFANVANGESLSLVVPADTYTVQIVPTGEREPVLLGPLDLPVEGGSLNRVFAVGAPEADSMNVVTHVIDVDEEGSEKPEVVNTGTGGQVAALTRLVQAFTGWWR
ncbi:MAG TPA: DUF4397 domain-containing protein [Ornithinimicrobium sp.]|uniref:DUF4397 domain-containing protein n=1 Tax=Ornithinimicrobium sp. TaxID=1977084 RepID=UPI002B46A8A3|nr:DUF4397 domain-containing protein [Ornithinimicrobium sp.]HKJ12745.1 DUF4397 domain-containing protein [Ornithinimicrobium sp.]